jgi:DNA-binding MarR family transcriptional regulator
MGIAMRPSQSLRLWQQVMLADVQAASHDLTMRQMAILLTVYLDPPPHTVRGLAEKLSVTKPVITRALDTMGSLKLLSRHRDAKDRRNVLVKRTVEGALFVERFGDLVIDKAAELPL